MHDIDRTDLEYDASASEFESPDPEYPQYEARVFDEAQEFELAAELLSIGSDSELDQFIGGLIKQAVPAIGKAIKSPVGRKLGGLLKGAAKKVLPMAAGAVGTVFGGPVGGALAAGAAKAAGGAFGLELEGLSPEDQEFEAARHFVRFAAEAARQAADGNGHVDPEGSARKAMTQAARRLAPGLLRPVARSLQNELAPPRRAPQGPAMAPAQSGRWQREGQRIVLLGV